MGASLLGIHIWKSPGRRARELAAWGLVSGLANLVEDEEREPEVGAVRSRVGGMPRMFRHDFREGSL